MRLKGPMIDILRKEHGLSVEELATAADVSKSTVLRAMGGLGVLPPTARRIADVLGVTAGDLWADRPSDVPAAEDRPGPAPVPDVAAPPPDGAPGGGGSEPDDERVA